MPVIKSSTPVSNGSIQMFADDGLLRQVSPVEQYIIFEGTQINESNNRIFKNDGGFYLPLIVYGTGASYTATINYRRNNVTLFTSNPSAANLNNGVVLPFYIITPDMEIQVINNSSTAKIPLITIFAKEVFVNKTVQGIA